MGSAATRKIEGFASIGGEVPWLHPHAIKIVGLDIDEAAENWFAYCPRAKEELEPEWIADIRENGVRTPVDCYRDANTVILLEGRRRVRAARIIWDEQKKAGVPEEDRIKVRVNVHKADPNTLFSYNVGSESRKDRSPMQRAKLMIHAQKYGADDKSIAKMFGVTTATVKNMLSLFDLSLPIQHAVDDGSFPLREAIKLVKLPREEQTAKYKELLAAGATHGAAASNGIAKAKRGEKVVKADRSRMRSRGFLEKWHGVLKKADRPEADALASIVKFVMGGPIPREADDALKETIYAAGFKKEKRA